MNNFEGMKCPVCGEELSAQNDIVVCPDCGTPHHRECWKRIGHCAHEELHRSSVPTESSEAPTESAETEAPAPSSENEAAPKICPICHTENDATASFCNSCGAPLRTGYTSAPMPTFQMLFDPLGGVNPDEEIDGVSAGELAHVVGSNSAYYIPRFQAISKKRKTFSLNFTALLFDIPWLFSRKMILPAIGVLIMELALAAPTIWAVIHTNMAGVVLTFSDTFWTMYDICSVLQVVLRFAVGLFGNRLYKNHCVALAQDLKHRHPEKEEFQAMAHKKGGISKFFLYLTAALTIVYYLFSFATGIVL